MKSTTLIVKLLLLLASSAVAADKFDLMALQGQWEGSGAIAIAASPMSLDIDGTASFAWDSTCACLKTALQAEKFMLKYSDSGKMYHNPRTDVVSWEMWDSYGRSKTYLGQIDADSLSGQARMFRGTYDVTVRSPHTDTLDVDFYYTNPDSVKQKTGYFKLWRRK
jgi:hypothetical protein